MELLVLSAKLEDQQLSIEVWPGEAPPITVAMTWDDRLQIAGAIAAGITAAVQFLRQQRR